LRWRVGFASGLVRKVASGCPQLGNRRRAVVHRGIGFVIGLTAGTFVLTAIYDGTGGSVLAVAVWHALYNLCAGTEAGDGPVAAVLTGCVSFWAVSLIQSERAGIPALGEGTR
jgi:membrane protease YdiL (CAAX protease family)